VRLNDVYYKNRRKLSEVREDTIELRQKFERVEYGFQSIDEAMKYAKAQNVGV